MKKHLGVIVVGAAGRQGKRRTEAVSKAGGLRLLTLVDIAVTEVARLANRYGCAHSGSWEEAVGKCGADIAIICTQNSLHEAIAHQAMRAGMHVLVEKPLATTPESGRRLVEIAAVTGRRTKVGFNHRFRLPMKAGLELVGDGYIGKVLMVRARAGHAQFVHKPDSWFCQHCSSGGGALLDLGSHLADVGRSILGDFEKVSAWAGKAGLQHADVEDAGEARFLTRDGRLLEIFVCWTDFRPFLGLQVEIFGEKGRVVIDFTTNTTCLVTRSGESFQKSFPFEDPNHSWIEEIQEFRDAILENRRPDGDGEDGLATLEMLAAAYQSAALQGQTVPVLSASRDRD